jgi:hypothetical protein
MNVSQIFVITCYDASFAVAETSLHVEMIFQFLVPPHEKAEYPVFVFCEGRSKDVMTINTFSISDDTIRCDMDVETDDELECEEFEIL